MAKIFCTGFQIPDITTKDGRRASSAEAFIKPNLQRRNFDILTKTFVTEVIYICLQFAYN